MAALLCGSQLSTCAAVMLRLPSAASTQLLPSNQSCFCMCLSILHSVPLEFEGTRSALQRISALLPQVTHARC
jgi:hypothetical protein